MGESKNLACWPKKVYNKGKIFSSQKVLPKKTLNILSFRTIINLEGLTRQFRSLLTLNETFDMELSTVLKGKGGVRGYFTSLFRHLLCLPKSS